MYKAAGGDVKRSIPGTWFSRWRAKTKSLTRIIANVASRTNAGYQNLVIGGPGRMGL